VVRDKKSGETYEGIVRSYRIDRLTQWHKDTNSKKGDVLELTAEEGGVLGVTIVDVAGQVTPSYEGAKGDLDGCQYEVVDEVAVRQESYREKCCYILKLELDSDRHVEYLFGYRRADESKSGLQKDISSLVKKHLIIPPKDLKRLVAQALDKGWF
jgi:hypothetical protein